MKPSEDHRAEVTYRANRQGGAEVELKLWTIPAAATIADAWARLSTAYPDIDPTSLEVEIRRIAAPRQPKETRAAHLVSAQCALPIV